MLPSPHAEIHRATTRPCGTASTVPVTWMAGCLGGPLLGMARADPEFPEGQIVGLHVLPSEWGRRIGSLLHDAALAVLLETQHRTAGLWVIGANQRARRMYESRGWVLRPGTEKEIHGIVEVRYRRELT